MPVGTVPMILGTERGRLNRASFLASVALLGLAQAVLAVDQQDRWSVLAALAGFFAAFNYLEARLPALLTTTAAPGERGAALGMFATAQFLGAFAGGAVGGLLLGRFGVNGVFWGSAALAVVWALALTVSARQRR